MAELIPFDAAVVGEKQTESTASQESKATAKMVNELVQRSNMASQDLRSEWPNNFLYVVGGKQWPIRRPRWRFSEVVNITWANIMTEVALQTDSRPTVDYSATEPSDFAFAEVLKQINEVNWAKTTNKGYGWHRKTTSAVFKCKLYHVVHAEVGWDPELADGLGDVCYTIMDPYGCFWDPTADNIHEARYFVYAEPIPTSKLKKEYPKFKDLLKPDVSTIAAKSTDGVDDHNIDLLWASANAGTYQPGHPTRTDRAEEKWGGEPMTLKLRCWLRDDTVEELKEEIEKADGSTEIEYVQVKKYPNGRYIEVANNMTLTDRENEFEDGEFPIATLVNYDYGEYAGENEVTHSRGPNNVVNYVWSFILDSMKMGNNPQNIIAAKDQDIVKKLTNEPGLNVVVSDPSSFRREPGPGIPAGLFNILDMSLGLVDKVSGLQDATRGAPQPGVTSGLMLEGFVEAAQTRPRLKNRSLDDFLQQVGYLMASRYLQFYRSPRVFRITNSEGFPEFVEFSIADSIGKDGEPVRTANIGRTTQLEGGQMMQHVPQQVVIKGLPDVKIESGSALPFARAQKTATALDLHSRQAITLESLLKAINWPNAEEETKRVQEEQQAMAAQQEVPQ